MTAQNVSGYRIRSKHPGGENGVWVTNKNLARADRGTKKGKVNTKKFGTIGAKKPQGGDGNIKIA